MKKWWLASILVLSAALPLVAAGAGLDVKEAEAASAELAPASPASQAAVPPPAAIVPAPPAAVETLASGTEETQEVDLAAAPASATGVVCTFNCNDGTGLLYQCPDPGLGTCCGQAQPACAAHGGLDSGICRKGRLGLSCVPL